MFEDVKSDLVTVCKTFNWLSVLEQVRGVFGTSLNIYDETFAILDFSLFFVGAYK